MIKESWGKYYIYNKAFKKKIPKISGEKNKIKLMFILGGDGVGSICKPV